MIYTVVCGIDHHREWMLQVIACDCVTGSRNELMWFFNTRAEAEAHLERVVKKMTNKNAIFKILKVRAFEHLGLDFEPIEKGN